MWLSCRKNSIRFFWTYWSAIEIASSRIEIDDNMADIDDLLKSDSEEEEDMKSKIAGDF